MNLPRPDLPSLARRLGKLRKEETHTLLSSELKDANIPPGQTRTLSLIQPPGKVSSRAILQLECQVQALRLPDALRQMRLTITFDGSREPQVDCPLGDFFGTSPGVAAMMTIPLRTSASGRLVSHWIMPYARSARIEVKNAGAQPIALSLEVVDSPYEWTERSLHFHARWNEETLATRPYRDWNVATIQGQGHLVGTMLSVTNPVPSWWGEGESKIVVDGESFPSHWGTGTDDDFGCGWADGTLFCSPWHAQPRKDSPQHDGTTCLFRCRLLDRIPFQKALRLDVEARHDQPGVEVGYAATSYWYARPRGKR